MSIKVNELFDQSSLAKVPVRCFGTGTAAKKLRSNPVNCRPSTVNRHLSTCFSPFLLVLLAAPQASCSVNRHPSTGVNFSTISLFASDNFVQEGTVVTFAGSQSPSTTSSK